MTAVMNDIKVTLSFVTSVVCEAIARLMLMAIAVGGQLENTLAYKGFAEHMLHSSSLSSPDRALLQNLGCCDTGLTRSTSI